VLADRRMIGDDPSAVDQAAASRDNDPLLVVEGLTVRFESRHGHTVAVNDVSFTLGRGERVALIGESGSGKTASCLAVAGLLAGPGVLVSKRKLSLDGTELQRSRRSRLPTRTPGLAMVFQDAMTSLDPVWTIGSQLRAILRSTGRRSRREASELASGWLRRVGLVDTERVLRSRPYELSGGMRQRVMLALALCSEPILLIADEPTSALDASLSRDVLELLLQLTQEMNTTLLIVSHDIRLSQEYCDRTLVMYGGRIIEEGPSDRLRNGAKHPYTTGLLKSIPTLENAGIEELPTIAAPVGVGQADPGGGCGFRPRCPKATDLCAAAPEVVQFTPDHSVRCWHVEDDTVRFADVGVVLGGVGT
jgi:oligopeptide/dipeptide ABC transporter ATP-binding protein